MIDGKKHVYRLKINNRLYISTNEKELQRFGAMFGSTEVLPTQVTIPSELKLRCIFNM